MTTLREFRQIGKKIWIAGITDRDFGDVFWLNEENMQLRINNLAKYGEDTTADESILCELKRLNAQ